MELQIRYHIALCLLFVPIQPTMVLSQERFAQNKLFQLSAPKVEVDSVLFLQSCTITVKESMPGAQVFYQWEGETRPFSMPLMLSCSTKVSIWADHPDFLKSDSQEIQVAKISDALASATISLSVQPHASYSGEGAHTLIDQKKGSTNFRNGKAWLGFQEKELTISFTLPKPTKIKEVQLGILVDQGSWIFMPASLEVSSEGKSIGKATFPNAPNEDTAKSTFVTCAVQPGNYQSISLTIHTLEAIPDWHPGKRNAAWLFIDEILIQS